MNDQTKQALTYIAAALSEYAAALQPAVRGPFQREAQAALKLVEDALPKESEKE